MPGPILMCCSCWDRISSSPEIGVGREETPLGVGRSRHLINEQIYGTKGGDRAVGKRKAR